MPKRRYGKLEEFYEAHKTGILRANDFLSLVSAFLILLFLSGDLSKHDLKRQNLVNEIKINALISGLRTGHYYIDNNVLLAIAQVPRHRFLNWKYQNHAYLNIALPLDGKEYFMPEPFVTATMFHFMDIQPHERVLEIGFGTGYEAAVLSQLAKEVYSIQAVEPLREKLSRYTPAEERGYKNVTTRTATGISGWKAPGTFDAILVKQAMEVVPPQLLDKLAPDGHLVIPIGPHHDAKVLMVYHKREDGSIYSYPTLLLRMPSLFQGHDI